MPRIGNGKECNETVMDKEENSLEVVIIQDNLLPEKHKDQIFGDPFMKLRKHMDGFTLSR